MDALIELSFRVRAPTCSTLSVSVALAHLAGDGVQAVTSRILGPFVVWCCLRNGGRVCFGLPGGIGYEDLHGASLGRSWWSITVIAMMRGPVAREVLKAYPPHLNGPTPPPRFGSCLFPSALLVEEDLRATREPLLRINYCLQTLATKLANPCRPLVSSDADVCETSRTAV